MSKSLTFGLTGLLIAASVAAPIVPAAAAPQNRARQEAIVEKFCREHPRRPVCDDWRRNRHNWDEARYRRWYSDHRNDLGQDAAIAGLFGFAAGAIVGTAAGQAGAAAPAGTVVYSGVPAAGGFAAGTDGWLQYCSAKYRSFDPASGTFLGNDGQRHYCQ